MGTVEKTRYEHIDYAKGIGVLMIMFAHVVQNFSVMTPANLFVRAFHVPIFFVAAGYLFACKNTNKNGNNGNSSRLTSRSYDEKKDFKSEILNLVKKRVKTLLIPYIIFSLFNSALKISVLFVTHAMTGDALKSELVELLITGNGTVWFLLTLFFTEVLFNMVYIKTCNTACAKTHEKVYIKLSDAEESKISQKYVDYIIALMCVVCTIIPYIIMEAKTPVGIVAIRVVAAMSYYCIGYFLLKISFIPKIKIYTGNSKGVLPTLVFICGVMAWMFLGADIDFFNGHFANMIGSVVSSALLSCGAILALSQFEDLAKRSLSKKNALVTITRGILNYYGKNSLTVTLVHPTVLLVIMYPFGHILTSFVGVTSALVSIALFVFLCITQIPCILFIDRFMPFVVGKKREL